MYLVVFLDRYAEHSVLYGRIRTGTMNGGTGGILCSHN